MGTQRQIDMTFDISYPNDQAKFLQRLGEKTSTDIVVQVFNKGVPYNLSGITLGFEMRNDKEKILIDKDQSRFTLVLPLEGVFSYRPPVQVQSFYGNSYLAYFTFESGDNRVTTERFRFYNDEDVQLAVAPELQEHYVSVIDDLVASNAEAIAKANEVKDLINNNQVVKKVDYDPKQLDQDNKITANENNIASMKKKTETINAVSDTKGSLDVANFAGQGQPNAPIGNIFHHYTDATMMQIDNVGQANAIMVLKNAQNAVRRPDKPANFVGSGKFLSLYEHNNATSSADELFFISKDGEFNWTGAKGLASFVQNKTDDNTFGYRFRLNNAHYNVFDFINGGNQLFYILNNVTKTRLDFVTPVAQSNGMHFESKAGNINFLPAGKATVKGSKIQTAQSGTTANRPATADIGETYFDTTLNRQIVRNASNNGWVDPYANDGLVNISLINGATAVGGRENYASRKGNTVTVQINVKRTDATNAVVGTLPPNYRPEKLLVNYPNRIDTSGNTQVAISSSGDITIASASAEISMTVTFVAV